MRSATAASRARLLVLVLCVSAPVSGIAQGLPAADPGSLAFEQGRWEDVITEYRAILAERPEDRMSRLRIAQAERELGRHEAALATLEEARRASAPEAMIELERARNLLALGKREEALAALEASDHLGLRARELLESAPEFDSIRDDERFELVELSVRARVLPCEGSPTAGQFDFWLGRWEVRQPDGTLVGYDTITKRDGGCTIYEQWDGYAGASGTSLTFYLPSREQWRQVWVGSGATLIDMTGGLIEDEMRMEGTIEYAEPNRVVAFRGTWSVATDGRVRQRMEEFDIATGTWVLWFDGLFRRTE
jgi:hypothetical protein